MFLRLGLCNLDCHVCDTPYTWDWEGKNGQRFIKRLELTHQAVSTVSAWAYPHQRAGRLVVVTGGEPLVQRAALTEVLPLLMAAGPVEIETNGTLPPFGNPPTAHLAYNVSPKTSAMLANASERLVADSMWAYAKRSDVRWKFVVDGPAAVEEVEGIVAEFEINWSKVWLMPEGVSADALNERFGWLCETAVSLGANISHRLHVLAWGNERGR